MEFFRLLHRLWPFDHFLRVQRAINKNALEVLDAGCGSGCTMAKISKSDASIIVGMDIFHSYLRQSKMLNLYHALICCDIRYLPFRRKTFDTVLLLDVLEHLTKEDGEKIIRCLEEIARKQVIILTTVGFIPQRSLHGNIFQEHRSGWVPKEFKKLGYKVRGINGLYFLRGEYGQTRFSGIMVKIALLASHLSDPFVYLYPKVAFHMLCVKNIVD